MKKFLQGNEACALGAIYAGCRFYAGYPITPSSEIMERMAVELPKVDGVFIQMEDEIASMGAVVGAAWAGAKAMTATSGPGLTLMLENIGYAIMTETPCVVVDIQRAGPSTGQATKPASGDIMQVRWGASGDYEIIALSPWSVTEMYEMTIQAFNLSETYRLPVFLMADEAVGHLRESAILSKDISVIPRSGKTDLPPFGNPQDNSVTPMPAFGQGRKLSVTGSTHDHWGYRKTQSPEVQAKSVSRFCNKILQHLGKICSYEKYFVSEDTEILVIAYGFTARSALKAVEVARQKSIKAGLIRLKTLWPFPYMLFHPECFGTSNISKIIVPEMNQGQIIREVQRVADRDVFSYNKSDGTVITALEIIEKIEQI
ncbi:MAG: 2-oxoacid:acceptor oxidoreductase subunit alpha [Planctomycetota bacterium]|nr:2-oxoacid:acceptor oxidoreductase subunit alpha [Planctomycetota bacterium]MDI6786879.1 2-oxoacid:acceptor oxidoreductase subunit alpha [Planctomycetota bacterium]